MQLKNRFSPGMVMDIVCWGRGRYALSRAEIKVLIWVLQAYTTPEIAEYLDLSQQSVKFHLTAIFKKTKARNRMALLWAFPLFQKSFPKGASTGLNPHSLKVDSKALQKVDDLLSVQELNKEFQNYLFPENRGKNFKEVSAV